MIDTLLLRPSLHFTTLVDTSHHLISTPLPYTPLHDTGRHFTSPHLNSTQLHFTPLHDTGRHFTSPHLNSTQLHFTTLSFVLTPFKYPTAPFHLTSLHFTALLDDFHHTSVPFTSPCFCFPDSQFKHFSHLIHSHRPGWQLCKTTAELTRHIAGHILC
jgi:hypothetical protein